MKPRIRMLAVLVAAIALLVLLVAAFPASASASDKDCSDFPSQRAAQLFFLRHGGPRYDPDRLDGDNDGIACEDNPCPCYFGRRLPHRALLGDLAIDRLRLAA
jgi:hypothetical protein